MTEDDVRRIVREELKLAAMSNADIVTRRLRTRIEKYSIDMAHAHSLTDAVMKRMRRDKPDDLVPA